MKNKKIMIYDAVIVGGGHNGLVAACYLAKEGKKVLIIEKNDYIGGATTSQKVFPDYEAYLSRYSYLVSLLPQKIIEELGLEIELLKRKTASFTPYESHKGLIISNIDEEISKKSVLDLDFGEEEWEQYNQLLEKQKAFAEIVWDSFLQPLRSKDEWEKYFYQIEKADLWESFVEKPIGELIENHSKSDIFRGVLMTDAKIGSFTHAHDASLLQNKTFIYHIIGNKTGEWKVPKGGMGNVAKQLIDKALSLGVEMKTNAEVKNFEFGNETHKVFYEEYEEKKEVGSKYILLNVIPKQFIHLFNTVSDNNSLIQSLENEGTAFKMNILLERLPKLKNTEIKPEEAFGGTFHINQSYNQMEKSFQEAASGKIPETFPCEIYCHTLTDPSILSEELQEKGFHTITVFGIDMAYALFETENDLKKKLVVKKFFEGINQYLAEPIEDCIAKDKAGNLCIEAKSSVDLEKELGMIRGNIFHGALSWFFAENEKEIGTWGVETPFERVLICGSVAKRGGAVSGITGRNAAMKVMSAEL